MKVSSAGSETGYHVIGGVFSGDGTLDGNLQNDSGLVWLQATETIEITGNYVQSSPGGMALDITSAGEHGNLTVAGVVELEGVLDVYNDPGYRPAAGQITFITAGYIAGDFSEINYETPSWEDINGSLHFFVPSKTDTTYSLLVSAPFPSGGYA
jgi:hypothetical protein